MINTVEDLINFVTEECEKNGWHHLIQVDDGKNIVGHYNVVTNSKLHGFAMAVNKMTDIYNETKIK